MTDVELAVLDEGDGRRRPPAARLPGFARFVAPSGPDPDDAGFRVVAPDLRGFGDSDKPADIEAYRVGKSVGDLTKVLDALGIERAHVVGHDWGAGVAWAMALMAPERVDKLVVLSVGHPGVHPTLEQREKSWYMLLFQFPEAEEILRRERLRARPRVARDPSRPRRRGLRPHSRAQLVPREPAPAGRARAPRAPARARPTRWASGATATRTWSRTACAAPAST